MDSLRRLAARLTGSLVCAVALTAPLAGQDQTRVDETIRAERFVAPPDPIASAVLAPRHLNVSLTDPSPDRTRFLNEIGDGPVTMAVFSKPFHELGGLFVDYRANRNRTLTIRNNVGLEILSGTGAPKVVVAVP
ncbi:MAG: hypothetical protein JNJ80_17500, partial [Gemmatimonadetes bacterium]|nr:hypothetical protein [Gemmatimonadota bacterium]